MAKKLSAGRRPAASGDTKEAIKKAAQATFSKLGYDRATIRKIAVTAKVDPSLVIHFFKSKEQLFIASMQVPAPAMNFLEILKAHPKGEWADLASEMILENTAALTHLSGVLRAAATEPRAAKQLAMIYQNQYLTNFKVLKLDNPELRATLISSLMTGLAFTGEIVGLTGFANAPKSKKKKMLKAIINQILTATI